MTDTPAVFEAKKRKCRSRHRKSWIVGGGAWIWCWECGAIAPNLPASRKTHWAYPVGPRAENPALTSHKTWFSAS